VADHWREACRELCASSNTKSVYSEAVRQLLDEREENVTRRGSANADKGNASERAPRGERRQTVADLGGRHWACPRLGGKAARMVLRRIEVGLYPQGDGGA
jgi:hypothetical protein